MHAVWIGSDVVYRQASGQIGTTNLHIRAHGLGFGAVIRRPLKSRRTRWKWEFVIIVITIGSRCKNGAE